MIIPMSASVEIVKSVRYKTHALQSLPYGTYPFFLFFLCSLFVVYGIVSPTAAEALRWLPECGRNVRDCINHDVVKQYNYFFLVRSTSSSIMVVEISGDDFFGLAGWQTGYCHLPSLYYSTTCIASYCREGCFVCRGRSNLPISIHLHHNKIIIPIINRHSKL
jgi:hypothetical protein